MIGPLPAGVVAVSYVQQVCPLKVRVGLHPLRLRVVPSFPYLDTMQGFSADISAQGMQRKTWLGACEDLREVSFAYVVDTRPRSCGRLQADAGSLLS